MRREDLSEYTSFPQDIVAPRLTQAPVIPYQQPAPKEGNLGDIGNTLSSTVPMAAMFTRNKYIGWYGNTPKDPGRVLTIG